MYLNSESQLLYMNVYITDGQIKKFIFADGKLGADQLFCYLNTTEKVYKDDGLYYYIFFLHDLNITHEEFMNYLLALYEANI